MTTRKTGKSRTKASGSKNKVAESSAVQSKSNSETSFSEVLEAADRLSLDEQETLVEILRRRLAEAGRSRVSRDAKEARKEFSARRCRPVTAKELIREIVE